MLGISKMKAAGGKRLFDLTTPKEVVQSAYTTSASARPQVLSNGWIIKTVMDYTNSKILFYVSKDNFTTNPTQLCYIIGIGDGGFSVASFGTNVYIAYMFGSTIMKVVKFDATTVTNINLNSYAVVIREENGSSGFNAVSIACNQTNGNLTVAWSSKYTGYLNSFNIYSAKSVDGGATWTKQDGTAGVDQLTYRNDPDYNCIDPRITYMVNGFPIIVYNQTIINGGLYSINSERWYGSGWSSCQIYIATAVSYTQSSPSVTVQRYGANVGRIWCAWEGLDSTDSTYRNMRVSYSDDNGVTWSAMQKITSGNLYQRQGCSITTNNKGYVFVMYYGKGADNPTWYNIRQIYWNGTVWSSEIALTNQNVATVYMPSTCDNYYDWENPITIWQDNQDIGDKALLHFNGTNGSTTFTDASGKTWTANGNAQISTAQSVFGGASAYFDGSADYISTPFSEDFNLGTKDFTIHFRMKKGDLGILRYIFGKQSSFHASINASNNVVFTPYVGGSENPIVGGTISDTNWHHVAIVRSGGYVKIYIDGVGSSAVSLGSISWIATYTMNIGIRGDTTNSGFYGYIDEFCFKNGVAIWTSNFTPPTSELVYSNNPPSVDIYGKYYAA